MASDDDFTGKYVNFNKLDSDVQLLIKESVKARNNAYCPYSNFRVGAALLTDSGAVYPGCNVENISYGASICAERVAVCNAISSGDCNIKKIVVCADSNEGPVSPCGMCRQFIVEFSKNKDIAIYLTSSKLDSKIVVTSIRELLPRAFITFRDIS
ncbi:uncharacterized protein LOC106670244 isoform X1 [Cimex lectularius]|uniref:Cytidine deaminase n=1 Tax=Cimex lectularius TaxID=79782 RepID=A0A8I6S4Y9_CIMLE|nr:uncharacterized protein LOC106670244 isoform X1 [Cimex lectularius]